MEGTDGSTGDTGHAVSETAVDAAVRHAYFSDSVWTQLTNAVPILLVGLCALHLPYKSVAYTLLVLQAMTTGGMMLLARRFLAASTETDRAAVLRLYRALSLVSGMLWGGLMLPAMDTFGHSIPSMFVCVTLIVTIAITSLTDGTQRGISWAFLAGSVSVLCMLSVAYFGVVGPIPLIASLALVPALLVLTETVRTKTRLLVRVQLENKHLAERLSGALAAAEHLASRDSLTGLLNRRAFQSAAETLARTAHGRVAMALILVDLDHFKSINDRFGHAAGDAVLQNAARLILDTTGCGELVARGDGAVARWGGEEFIILARDCDLARAVALAEGIRARLGEARPDGMADALVVTGSFGIAAWAEGQDLNAVIHAADQAMYAAKLAGRNRTHVHLGDACTSADRLRAAA